MKGPASAARAAANRQAIGAVLATEPWLVGVRPAGDVVPGLARDLILHAAPPSAWASMSELLRNGLVGGALFEGLARTPEEAVEGGRSGRIRFGAAQDHAAMAGGVGCITASLPVLLIEDRAGGRRVSHFLMEGFGNALVLGMFDEAVLQRLRWFRDEFGPALDDAIRALDGLDLRELVTEALRRGDELHNRNAAATSMLAERLAAGFVRAGIDPDLQEKAFEFMRGNPQFFVAASLAASKLALDAGDGVPGSSLLTAVGANGRDCGIRVSGLPGEWFTAPAEKPDGVLLPGFGPEDVGPGCGDSLLVECAGLGAAALPAAPALWPLLGVDETRARQIVEESARIALAEHPHYRIPILGDRGAPTGVDVVEVVETGIRPVVDIVMVHPAPGRGVVGFGLTSPPMACFEQAAEALVRAGSIR